MKPLAIADLFCGAGGTSAGAVEAIRALGFEPKLTAINHWNVAIATHSANHPGARHLCTSLDSVDPRHLFKPGELKILWASPECTHHSVARGGKPINDQSRATAWCVIRWMEALQPDIVLIENVPEFKTWGPIGSNGRPLKSRTGELYNAWFAAGEACGPYRGGDVVLCAADYGDPTTRRRLFVQFVRGRRNVVWPDATHTRHTEADMFMSRKPWVAAREIIDWSLQGQSVFSRKRPLSPKTMRRIMAGLEKFGLKPFITPGNGERKTQSPRTHDVNEPTPTVTAQGHLHLAEPFIISAGGPECGARPVSQPMGTILTRDHRALAEPYLVRVSGSEDRRARSIEEPLQTVTAGGISHGIAEPFLIPQRGDGARSIDTPAPTVTTTSRGVGLAQPYVVRLQHNSTADSIEKPLGAVCANGTHFALAEPFLIHAAHGGKRRARSIGEPMPTVAGNRGDVALCEPHLLPQHGGSNSKPVSHPTPTVTCDGAIGLVEPFLLNYYGTGHADSIAYPLATVTVKDRHALVRPIVIIDGERYSLDIRFRMLQPHELAAAQGFKPDYKFTGNKSDQVKQIGNAVPRRLARALCLAALSQTSNVAELLTDDEAA